MNPKNQRLSIEELEAEGGALLPSKEVLSVPLLDLNVDIDLALALAAPIDLAVAANANAALPINGGVSVNALALLSSSGAQATQGVLLDQLIAGEAIAEGHQGAAIDQTHDEFPNDEGAAAIGDGGTTVTAFGGTDLAPGAATVAPVPESAAPLPESAETGAMLPESAEPLTDPAETAVPGVASEADNTVPPITATDDATAVTPSPGTTTETVQPVMDAAEPVVDAVAPAATAAVQPTADAVAPAAAAATEPATEAAETAPGDTQAVVDTVTPATDGLLDDPVGDIVDPTLEGVGALLDGGLLNVNVDVALDADLAAPIAGAVAANANVAAPVNASVSANIGTIGAESIAIADQTAIISQQLQDVTAHATVDQDAEIDQ